MKELIPIFITTNSIILKDGLLMFADESTKSKSKILYKILLLVNNDPINVGDYFISDDKELHISIGPFSNGLINGNMQPESCKKVHYSNINIPTGLTNLNINTLEKSFVRKIMDHINDHGFRFDITVMVSDDNSLSIRLNPDSKVVKKKKTY